MVRGFVTRYAAAQRSIREEVLAFQIFSASFTEKQYVMTTYNYYLCSKLKLAVGSLPALPCITTRSRSD